MNLRHGVLAAALIVTLVAALWPAREDTVEPVVRARAPSVAPSEEVPPRIAALAEPVAGPAHRLPDMHASLFPRQTWVPPPPPPLKQPPPPPPSPPPLPYKYLGRWVEDGKLTVFLVQGEQPVRIDEGAVLHGTWRVDEITDRQVTFTYLPLDMQSTLGLTP